VKKRAKFVEGTEVILSMIEGWCSRTPGECRSVESLHSYLAQEKRAFPPQILDLIFGEEERENFKTLAQILEAKGLSFKLTPAAVDAVMRPMRMYLIQRDSYRFFLEHYHEHPLLEELIRKSILGIPRLSFLPTANMGGNTMAWFLDPWEKKKYKLSRNDGSNANDQLGEIQGCFSISMFSIFYEHSGSRHPFSRE
jgi:hypothetical protein